MMPQTFLGISKSSIKDEWIKDTLIFNTKKVMYRIVIVNSKATINGNYFEILLLNR